MGMIIVILVIASLHPFAASDRQGDALYDMKQKLNATETQLTDWNQNQVNPCTWNSVICDSGNNVVQVTLASMGFTGVLSPRIGELDHLNVLSLPGNKITGGIPEQLGNLSSLTSLDLEDNLLLGEIPASLGHLTKLQLLILSQNSLNGSIPDTLATISSLTDIRLAYNSLSGQIPAQLFEVARYNFSGNNLTCGANFVNPCASSTSYQGSSRGSKIGIVLGTVGGVIGLLTIGALFIICNGRRKGHLREVFVDVSGSVFSVLTSSDYGSMMKVGRREVHEGRRGGLAKGGSSLRAVEGLAWCSGFHSRSMKVGATTHVKFRVLPFR